MDLYEGGFFMKKKQKLLSGFTVMVLTVIFTIAGCASTGEFLKPTEFPSDFIGAWERVDQTKITKYLIFTPSRGMTANYWDTIRSTMKDSSQSYYWFFNSGGYNDTYNISPSYNTGLGGNVKIKLVDSNLVISDDYLAGNPEYDWSGTWRRINDFDKLDYNPNDYALKSYGLKVMVHGSLVPIADITNYTGNATKILIPPGRDGLMITNIAGRAFYNKNLTYVYFPNGNINTIQTQAFANNQLTALNLPNNIISIGDQAFANNPLTSITIGANVDFIGIQFGIAGQGRLIYSGFDDNSSLPIGYNFEKTYIEGGRQAGTYTRSDTSSTTWTKEHFPTDFIGTWKRDNFDNMLTFSADFFTDSAQPGSRANHVRVSGDLYTCAWANNGREFTLTFRLLNGSLVISGDSGDGEKNWNGTWKKIN